MPEFLRRARRFWIKVDVRGPDECWPWTGTVAGGRAGGYGNFRWSSTVVVGAHVAALRLTGVEVPKGNHVDHRCHDETCRETRACPHRRCCNPMHLRVGTPVENWSRGNGKNGRGWRAA